MWLLAGRTLCASHCLSAKLGIAYLKTEGLALCELAKDVRPAASLVMNQNCQWGELPAGFAAFL